MMEWDIGNLKIIDKKVSDYSGRKRINITNSDGLVKDDAVVIMKKSDYDNLITDYMKLLKKEQEQDNSKATADNITEKFIKPLQDSYTNQLNDIKEEYKQTISSKDKEINRLKAIYQEYDKQVYSLGLLDILRRENKKISDDFNSKIWISSDDSLVTAAEVKGLTDHNNSDVPADDDDGVNSEWPWRDIRWDYNGGQKISLHMVKCGHDLQDGKTNGKTAKNDPEVTIN